MFARIAITLTLISSVILVPAAAAADALATPSLGGGASASGLGPVADPSAGAGSSSADSSALQPAGSNTLQSSTNASSGLTAPTSNALQAPASSTSTLQVLSGEADGSQHALPGSSLAWLWWLLAFIVALIIIVVIWRRLFTAGSHKQARSATAGPPESESEAAASEVQPEPVRSQTLTITIKRPAADIFAYTLDPANTPKWIDAITVEETNEAPSKLGTIYKNKGADEQWREFEVIGYKENDHFTLAQLNGPYRVKYALKPVEDDATELEYYEWMEEGELDPFPAEPLQKLKSLLEAEPEPKPTEKEAKKNDPKDAKNNKNEAAA